MLCHESPRPSLSKTEVVSACHGQGFAGTPRGLGPEIGTKTMDFKPTHMCIHMGLAVRNEGRVKSFGNSISNRKRFKSHCFEGLTPPNLQTAFFREAQYCICRGGVVGRAAVMKLTYNEKSVTPLIN